MFRSTHFDKLLEKATSQLLMEPDWKSNLEICDLIRQNDIQPKYVLAALKKKMFSPNQYTALYALLVLETIVKNCGSVVHEELTTKQYCDTLHELAKSTVHETVRQKLLELIQAWSVAFRKNPKHGALKDLMATMKAEGYKFPTYRESDAMFSADSAPEWADGNVCHRCRVQFTLIQRKHHCRACGQVFCGQCASKFTSLPKYGIEKTVRVCDACYDQANKPASTKSGSKDDALPPEYVNSSLAQQSQSPPRKSEDELREEEELNLAIAISQSEAEAKEKEKLKFSTVYKQPEVHKIERSPSPVDENTNPELAKYLNRSYWESIQNNDDLRPASPSAPTPNDSKITILMNNTKKIENGLHSASNNNNNNNVTGDNQELEDFIKTLKSQVEIFINRMKSNSSRGRSIAYDSSVQTLFMNITAMHSKLLNYIQQHDDSRLYYERLQDKLTQIKDARAALDALREEHKEKLRREAEEAERLRQLQMAQKLEIMRKKKQEYLQYQRQLALQRIQEQEREMHMRQEQQKQQYLMNPQYAYIGSPVHAQFSPQQQQQQQPPPPPPPQQQPQQTNYNPAFQYGQPMGLPQSQGQPIAIPPPSQGQPMGLPPAQSQAIGMPAPAFPPPTMQGAYVTAPIGFPGQGQQQPPPQQQQQQQQQQPKKEETQTAELISFD